MSLDPAYPIADFRQLLSDHAKIELSHIELAEILWLAVQRSERIAPVDLSSRSLEPKTSPSKSNDFDANPPLAGTPELRQELKTNIGVNKSQVHDDSN